LISRRRFLSTVVIVSAGGTAASGVGAFSIEEPAASLTGQYHAARDAACGGSSAYHEKVLADLRALIAGHDLADDEKQEILTQATCPLCGCPVASS
jgi:hypothetical protein